MKTMSRQVDSLVARVFHHALRPTYSAAIELDVATEKHGTSIALCSPMATLPILQCGNCEPLKASVHGIAMATAAVCAAYNLAAWLSRRQMHLAVNAMIYTAVVIWEGAHVRHHVAVVPGKLTLVPDDRVA